MVDTSLNLYNKQVVVVKDTWEEFLARLLVNRKRSASNILQVDTYKELLDTIATRKTLDAGLVDSFILSPLQEEMQSRNLGNYDFGFVFSDISVPSDFACL